MKTIWKYKLPLDGAAIEMPQNAAVLHVGTQRSGQSAARAYLWALVNPCPSIEMESRVFCAYGTGHDVPADHGPYIGTTHHAQGALVFHWFEKVGG